MAELQASDNPFTPEDLQHILHEEECNSEEEGWQFLKRTESAEIWRKNDGNSAINLVKAFLHFPGIPPADVLELIQNVDIRGRWDVHFSVIEVVEELPNYKIVYWHFKMPPGVYDRDLVQYVTYRKDEEKNLFYILYKNATDDRRPEVPGLVRAKTILSGTLIRPYDDDPNSTKLTILLQNDPMGWIPKFMVNMLASRAPIEWQERLSKFYHDVYIKEKGQQQTASEK